jgi:hypothetical protein
MNFFSLLTWLRTQIPWNLRYQIESSDTQPLKPTPTPGSCQNEKWQRNGRPKSLKILRARNFFLSVLRKWEIERKAFEIWSDFASSDRGFFLLLCVCVCVCVLGCKRNFARLRCKMFRDQALSGPELKIRPVSLATPAFYCISISFGRSLVGRQYSWLN